MNKEKFVKKHLDDLLEDSEIKEVFERSDDISRTRLKDSLKYSLEKSYDEYAADYYNSRGLNYLATTLRTTGAALNVAGSSNVAYLVWALGPAGFVAAVPAYFGFKRLGLAANTAADILDAKRLAKSDSTLVKKAGEQAKVLTEGAAERAIAYYVPGGEVLDYFRGRRKFDNTVINNAKYNAKDKFLSYVNDELKIVPKDYLRNPYYAERPNTSLATAP